MEGAVSMTKTNAKEQAGKKLLAAIDEYIYAVLAVQAEERALDRNRKQCESAEELKKMLSRPAECKPGPYEQYLRESMHA